MKAKTILAVILSLLIFPVSAHAAAHFFPGDALVIVKVDLPPQNTEYVVKNGDTLSKISKSQGVSVKDILAANTGLDPKKIRVGQKILVPSKEAKASGKNAAKVAGAKAGTSGKSSEYIVASGDTLSKISAAQGVALKDILAANAGLDPNQLKVGQKILIPSKDAGAPEKTVASVPAAADASAGKAKVAPAETGQPADVKKTGKQPLSKTLAAMKTPPPAPQAEQTAQTPPSAKAYGKTGIITNNTDVPMAIRQEFNDYGRKWLDVSEQLAVGTKNNKKVRKVGDVWEASYRVILKDTMGTEVKRVQYEHTPYVGHLTYAVLAYVSTGATKDAALNGAYQEKEEHMREIFSYDGKKKAWR